MKVAKLPIENLDALKQQADSSTAQEKFVLADYFLDKERRYDFGD
jgi:hypothetical protein